MTQPACMTDREYELWSEANEHAKRGWTKTPCTDCPVAFAREMRSEGCCDGSPGPRPAHRPRLADTPQRRKWRENSARFRLARARAGWDNGAGGVSTESNSIPAATVAVLLTPGDGRRAASRE